MKIGGQILWNVNSKKLPKSFEFIFGRMVHKGRVVLRGDIVKDDSGSYAAFTEQGSSADQMTAAKTMDIISRLHGCAGQTAEAVSAYTQEKWKMLTNCSNFPNKNVQTFGFVYHDAYGLNHGPPSRSSWPKYSWSSVGRTVVGKAIWENPIWNTVGKNFQLGMPIRTPWKGYSYVYVDDIKIGWKQTQYWSDVESTR